MNILIVKLSSLGDVLHNLPVVWDIRARYPDARLDWVVEEAYVGLLEPLLTRDGMVRGIDRIIPIALRRWKKKPFAAKNRAEFRLFRQRLRECAYDAVIETQGLIKSALVTRLARRAPSGIIAGLANKTEYSGYEPLARWCYTLSVSVPWRCHAVDRSRSVAAAALGLADPQPGTPPPRFYPGSVAMEKVPQAGFDAPYVLCFHATARSAKRWPDTHWVDLGRHLAARGLTVLFPWGSASEKTMSEMLASQVPGAKVPRAFSLHEAFHIVGGAELTVGVDTGLTHLAAVLGRPTIEIYADSPRWKTEAYWSESVRNLGDMKTPPEVEEVLAAASALLEQR